MKALKKQELNAKLNIPERCHLTLIKASVGTTETWNRHFNRALFDVDKIESIIPITENKLTGEMKILIEFISGHKEVFICGIGRELS